MKLLDKRPNPNHLIFSGIQPVLKDLKSKYCPLYELTMNSLLEDIEPKKSFTGIVASEKAAQTMKVEKKRLE
jgi:hypothetical protein